MKRALLLPSRQRLNKFLTFLTSVVATAEDIENISIILGIDEDDRSSNLPTQAWGFLRSLRLCFSCSSFSECEPKRQWEYHVMAVHRSYKCIVSVLPIF